jgi:hypothetical protein
LTGLAFAPILDLAPRIRLPQPCGQHTQSVSIFCARVRG